MIKKTLFVAMLSVVALTIAAEPAPKKHDDKKKHEEAIQEMMGKWQSSYIDMDVDNDKEVKSDISDEVYIERFKRMQVDMEMPFNDKVRDYIEMYTRKERQRKLVSRMLGKNIYYLPIFEAALSAKGLPMELKYLPVIESALNPSAVSRAGAAGLWQFMPSTGRGLGLEITSLVDERRDPHLSSEKAAEFLKSLYETYGDWSLAIAAYNCGPGNVNKALRRAGVENDEDVKNKFWKIYNYLPKETRGYVPCFYAAVYVMNYYPEHGIKPVLAKEPLTPDTVHVKSRVHFNQIAAVLDVDKDVLGDLNPQYLKDLVPGSKEKPYVLTLPTHTDALAFVAVEGMIDSHESEEYARTETIEVGNSNGSRRSKKNNDDESSSRKNVEDGSQKQYADNGSSSNMIENVITHKVEKGENLRTIAEKYNLSVNSIRKNNNVKRGVKRGQELKIVTYKRVDGNDKNLASARNDLAVASNSDIPARKSTVKSSENKEPVPYPKKNKNKDEKEKVSKKKTNKQEKDRYDKSRRNKKDDQVAKNKRSSKKDKSKNNKKSRKNRERTKSVTVKDGQNLSVIARKNGTTVEKLKKLNPQIGKNNIIRGGDKIRVK